MYVCVRVQMGYKMHVPCIRVHAAAAIECVENHIYSIFANTVRTVIAATGIFASLSLVRQ